MVTLLNCSYAHEKFSTIKKFTISDAMILFCITETATITYNLHLNELEMSILQIYRLLP